MIVALAGGVGGARLAKGLANILAADELLIVVNTADDCEHLGLHVSPDLDTVMYTLASLNHEEQGWGRRDDTWRFMEALEEIGGETWFRLGDADLAVHIARTERLGRGDSLSAVTRGFCTRLGIRQAVVPMTDDAVRTLVHTDEGVLAFQDYFVRRHAAPCVVSVQFAGAEQARISDAVRVALSSDALRAIVICPSNPYLSIAPILAIRGYRELIGARQVPAIAVSPIVGGQAIKGPLAKMMREWGKEPSPLEVARLYANLIDGMVIDEADAALTQSLRALGVSVLVAHTVMRTDDDRTELARRTMTFAHALATHKREQQQRCPSGS